MYQSVANGHSSDFYYKIEKNGKIEINLIFISVLELVVTTPNFDNKNLHYDSSSLLQEQVWLLQIF